MLGLRRSRLLVALLTAAALVWSTLAWGATNKAAKASAAKAAAHNNAPAKAATSKSSQKRSTRRVSSPRRRPRKESFRTRLARQKLQPQRIEEIQRGLIQAGYLNEEPTGKWDNSTREAMRAFQHAYGFPETGLPEAKSLMKLGLGPHPLPEDLDPTAQASANPAAVAPPANEGSPAIGSAASSQ